MAESTLSSNNPFRRDSVAPAHQPTADPNPSPSHTAEQFRTQLNALPASALPPPTTSFQKPKVVKRVRVQSPPPSSPESTGEPFPEWPVWPGDHDIQGFEGGQEDDGFVGEPCLHVGHGGFEKDADAGQGSPVRENFTTEFGQNARLGNFSKAPALDVSSFSRLLLTGQRQGSPDAGSSATPGTSCAAMPAGDSGSMTDASSVSRQSIFDMTYGIWETPRTSHEISDVGEDEHRELVGSRLVKKTHSTLKKKPPPPSSRHGRLIQVELQNMQDEKSSLAASLSDLRSSAWDVNKPLPPAPGGPALEDGYDSVFDREAAGKVPELDPDPNAPASKKPPPPPKRGHGRTNSKSLTNSFGPVLGSTLPGDDGELTPSRSSLESIRSRSSSLRINANIPPPPPRRNHVGGRHSGILTSPSEACDEKMWRAYTSLEASDSQVGSTGFWPDALALGVRRNGSLTSLNAKASPPPPPPTRSASTRSRKPSVSSIEANPRRTSREKDGPQPPPPPPRQRGNSRGSMEGPAQFSRRTSLESERIMEEADEDGNEAGAESAADSILAHLDALQREVDALRERQERGT